MGIITVSLQRELAEMKAVFNVQKSPGNYLKARERERERDRRRQGGKVKLILMGSKKDDFSGITSGETSGGRYVCHL